MLDGYTFNKTGVQYWYCSKRKAGCKARIKLNKDDLALQKRKKNYDPTLIELAIAEAIKTRKVRRTARKYGIAKSTLYYKIKNPGHRTISGPPPILTNAEEDILEEWILELLSKGFSLKRENLIGSAQKILTDSPRPNCFKNNSPGHGWFKTFLRRHPAINYQTKKEVFNKNYDLKHDIRKWLSTIQGYLEEKELLKILDEPNRVFIGEESHFVISPNNSVDVIKSSKVTDSMESITVMLAFAADGQGCPPMVVYKNNRVPQKVAQNKKLEGWAIGQSKTGRMSSELFWEYIVNVFHPYLIEKEVTFPVIIFLDGRKTNLTYEVTKKCVELNIELIGLHPDASAFVQTSDEAVIHPITAAWKKACQIWLMENPNKKITRVNFAEVLDNALQNSIEPQTLINGFKACGLMPFDPDVALD